VDQDVEITLPWRFNDPVSRPTPSIVSALGKLIDSAPPVTTSNASVFFRANRALMTIDVPLV
jgi:hypothetical protein